MKLVSGLVFKLWRYVLECCGLWLCDSSDKVGSKKLNMAGMWPWVTKELLKWEKAKNILFHSKLILSTFLWKGVFLDSTSAELLSLRSIWYRCSNMCLMTCNTSLLVWRGVSDIFTMLNYFAHLTSFKEIGSLIENTQNKKHHFYCVADTLKLMFFLCVLY